MSELSSRLEDLPGVQGYAVFDAAYRCKAHHLPADIDASMVVQTLLQLQTAFDTFAMSQGEIVQGSVMTFVAECSGGSLALRRIGSYQIATILEAGSDPTPLVKVLDEFSEQLESSGEHHTLEDSIGNLTSDDNLDGGTSLEFYSASLETPAPLETEEPSEPSATDSSIWTTGVKEIVGKLGKKKKDE